MGAFVAFHPRERIAHAFRPFLGYFPVSSAYERPAGPL